jgi:hypothetical protein
MREFYRTGGGLPLPQWIEQKSREFGRFGRTSRWDWRALADQLDRDALHGEWTLGDVALGWAQVVRCLDCGAIGDLVRGCDQRSRPLQVGGAAVRRWRALTSEVSI